jgi:fructosamine-3-kinase
MWDQISAKIALAIGQPVAHPEARSVSGGCINQGYQLTAGDHTFFVKLNAASQLRMFEAEAIGLAQMAATQTIRVPQPICTGIVETGIVGTGIVGASAYLVLEWLDLGRSGRDPSWKTMGRHLAQLHEYKGSTAFGWSRDNTIGTTSQPNPWTHDWVEFWQIHRIGYQLQLAAQRGGNLPQSTPLLAAIPTLLAGHQPVPSLVHGDLWGGNAAVTTQGEPVIFDPAPYWGDREVDLAMTELFGGFPAEFYTSYNATYAIDPGYQRRKPLYNLYHILNHYNLFGGSYLRQANQTIAALLC